MIITSFVLRLRHESGPWPNPWRVGYQAAGWLWDESQGNWARAWEQTTGGNAHNSGLVNISPLLDPDEPMVAFDPVDLLRFGILEQPLDRAFRFVRTKDAPPTLEVRDRLLTKRVQPDHPPTAIIRFTVLDEALAALLHTTIKARRAVVLRNGDHAPSTIFAIEEVISSPDRHPLAGCWTEAEIERWAARHAGAQFELRFHSPTSFVFQEPVPDDRTVERLCLFPEPAALLASLDWLWGRTVGRTSAAPAKPAQVPEDSAPQDIGNHDRGQASITDKRKTDSRKATLTVAKLTTNLVRLDPFSRTEFLRLNSDGRRPKQIDITGFVGQVLLRTEPIDLDAMQLAASLLYFGSLVGVGRKRHFGLGFYTLRAL